RQLNSVPFPGDKSNTALYSAVVSGLDVMEKLDPSFSRLLIVMTDGMNDVGHAGDDPGLLADSQGLQTVLSRVRKAQLTVFTIGFGNQGDIDEAAMRQIAYPAESNFILASDANALSNAFVTVRERFTSNFRVTTAIDRRTFRELTGTDHVFK